MFGDHHMKDCIRVAVLGKLETTVLENHQVLVFQKENLGISLLPYKPTSGRACHRLCTAVSSSYLSYCSHLLKCPFQATGP